MLPRTKAVTPLQAATCIKSRTTKARSLKNGVLSKGCNVRLGRTL